MPGDEGLEASAEECLTLPRPEHAATGATENWRLIAHDRRVVEGWRLICQQIPGNALRCYNWLSAHPTERIPRRCYELKHKNYTGAWGYEVGSAQRVYYKPRPENRDVLIYYAGPHPKRGIPYPPTDDSDPTPTG